MHETKMRTRELNDEFRKWPTGRGTLMLTAGLIAKGVAFMIEAQERVCTFEDFNEDNDPHEEHDFGSFELHGEKVLWKIDYYDKSMQYGSEDPNDPNVATRVLTIMLASEY